MVKSSGRKPTLPSITFLCMSALIDVWKKDSDRLVPSVPTACVERVIQMAVSAPTAGKDVASKKLAKRKLIGIGLSGKMYSGKTTFAKMIIDEYGSKKLSFADEVKAIATALFGMKQKDRRLLQSVGAKMREIHEDVWINVLLRNIKYVGKVFSIKKFPSHPIFVIDDVRYPNEKRKLEASGFIVVKLDVNVNTQIKRAKARDGINTLSNKELYHESEVALWHARFEHEIDSNRTVDEVWEELKELIDDRFQIKRGKKETAERLVVGLREAEAGVGTLK